MHEYLYSLKHSELSRHLSNDELEGLLFYSKIETFSPGDLILEQGKESDHLYYILSGNVIITAKILSEGNTKLETLGPDNFLGEISYIEKIPCATSVIASNPVQCLLISRDYMELLSEFFPQTKYKIWLILSKQVCDRINKMHDKITAHLSSTNMIQKSLFGDVIQSLNKPTRLNLVESNLTPEMLQKYAIFKRFSLAELDELLKHADLLQTPSNCVLVDIRQAKPSNFIVIQGAVQSSIVHENKAAKLSVIGPGTLFASISCIEHDIDFAITFTTHEEALLLKIGEPGLTYLQHSKPFLWYKLYELVCRSLVVLEKSVDKLDIRLHIENYNR